MKKRAVFLDRDGVINRDVPYCSSPEDFELLPGAVEGILILNRNYFKVVVVTNQSGVARGYFTEATLSAIHDRMKHDLAKYGAHIDAIYYCPHHPDDRCICRKPSDYMLLQAASQMNIDLKLSCVVGDSEADIAMGKKAGCKTFLVSRQLNRLRRESFQQKDAAENGKEKRGTSRFTADYIVPDLHSAACIITGSTTD